MRVLELFSGIGGMHFALKESGTVGEVIAAIDINEIANSVYAHNFPETTVLNKNILGLTADFINKLDVNAIFMSPPCQPFTRNGLKKDNNDARAYAFLILLDLLPNINAEYILIENVKGFEVSECRNILLQQLKTTQYTYQEFILSPHQFGVPNNRHRYYCLAKKLPGRFNFDVGPIKNTVELFDQAEVTFPISSILDKNVDITSFLLSENVLRKHANILDVCFQHSLRSCCFTKSYGKYIEGTGSVFTNSTEEEYHKTYESIQNLDPNSEEYLQQMLNLNLRFFTPKEISRLMCFPESFNFPNISNKQKYMLLGNSVNVKVVSELIKLLNK